MKIVNYPHPALRATCPPVTTLDKDLRLTAGRMLELMYERRGLGLAAPQVALTHRMFVVNVAGEPEEKEHEAVFINPVIVEQKNGVIEASEGCLSFPELYQKVRRAKTVVMQAYNLDGQLIEVTASELYARLLQHELDHLNGVLFIDKMGPLARLASRSDLKRFEAEFRKAVEKGEYPADLEPKF